MIYAAAVCLLLGTGAFAVDEPPRLPAGGPEVLGPLLESIAPYAGNRMVILKHIPMMRPPRRKRLIFELEGRVGRLLREGDPGEQAVAALAFAELTMLEPAQRLIDAAVHQDPELAIAHSVRAYVLLQAGDLAGAAKEARQAQAISPGERASLAILQVADGSAKIPLSALDGPAGPLPPFPGPDERPPWERPALGLVVVAVVFFVGRLLWRLWVWFWKRTITQALAEAQTAHPPAAPAPAPPAPPAPPAAPAPATAAGLRDYDVLRTVGRGGMGIVYEGRDKLLDRRVAIKKMRPEIREDPRERERFLKEAKLVAALHHPAIVDIFGIVADGEELSIVFEYVDGKTVDALLAERGRLDLQETRRILKPVCEALDFAHGRQVVHRDLKPSNIMLAADGGVKVMDFGIARQAKDSLSKLSMTNTVCGTPLYMAPEAEQGIVCRESDIFSLGAMTYELLTGKAPFGPMAMEAKRTRRYDKASALVPGLPPAVDATLDAALEPEPARRIRTAGDFFARLSAV